MCTSQTQIYPHSPAPTMRACTSARSILALTPPHVCMYPEEHGHGEEGAPGGVLPGRNGGQDGRELILPGARPGAHVEMGVKCATRRGEAALVNSTGVLTARGCIGDPWPRAGSIWLGQGERHSSSRLAQLATGFATSTFVFYGHVHAFYYCRFIQGNLKRPRFS